MANYTPTFTKPYPNGWVDKPSKTTPATAAIMNSYDTAIAALEAYLRDNAIDTISVSVEQFPSDGRQWLGTITVGNNKYKIYMPSLKYENSASDGVKIGTITLGEQSFDVYAPTSSAGGSTVSVVPKTLTGTNIAEITVDGTAYQLYAPTGGSGGGSTVTAEAILTEGTQIGKITIDGTETILYAPTASAITVDFELSATSENPVQNKVVKAEFDQVNSNLSNLKVSDVAGGKNLIVPTIQSVLEKNGIVVTDNNDGTYTVNGTNAATGNTTFDVYVEIKSQGSTSAKLLGCPPNDKGLILQTYYDGSWGNSSTWDRGNGSTIDDLTKLRRLSILIPGGKTVDNVVFKPMITTDMDSTYNDYEPYIPSVKMLASDLSDVKDGTTPVAKAVADEDGNNIKSTYVKKTEVPSGSIVDSELSETSTNPVQNKVVTTELNKKLETLDDESQAPDVVNFDLDSELSLTSTKGVQNKVITAALNGILKITDLSNKLKNGRYNDYSLNYDFSKCYKINNIIYGQLFITGLNDDKKPNERILVAAFDEDYFQGRTSDASFFCGYLEMLESNGNIYSSDKNNRIQIPLVYDPINYEIEAISLEDDTLHFQSTAILSGYFRLIT